MAKGFVETDAQCRQIVQDARNGVFSPVYLLMGDEPFYVDMVCDAVLDHCLDESEKDFNLTVCYGADVDADAVITAARRYPMFAERQLVLPESSRIDSVGDCNAWFICRQEEISLQDCIQDGYSCGFCNIERL